MITELIFASTNTGKIKEIHQILGNNFVIKGLKDVGITEEIPETGNTFYENAFLKANYVFQKTGKNTFADDSGLCIDALSGQPGVHSAYYAGLPKNDERNIQKVLSQLKNIENRQAKFVCVICLIYNGKINYFEGELKGKIALRPSGINGFGYDPIFIPEGYNNTLAELPSDIKNSISHRYKALEKMKIFLCGEN